MSRDSLIVLRVLGVGQVKDNGRVRLRTAAIREFLLEVNAAVEAHAAVLVEVDVQGLEIRRGVDDADLARLDEVVGDDEVLLVGSDLDVVGTDGGLVLIGVVQTLDVRQVADVESGNVVGGGEGEVEEAAVLGDIRAGGLSVLKHW